MRRIFWASLFGILLGCLSACSEEDEIFSTHSSDSDSIYLYKNIHKIFFTQPEVAIRRLDTCEMKGYKSPDSIRFYRGTLYGMLNNTDKMFSEWETILFREGADVGSPFYLHVLKSEASMKSIHNQRVKALEYCLLGDSLARANNLMDVSVGFRVLATEISDECFVQKENITTLESCVEDSKDLMDTRRSFNTYLFIRDDLYDAYCRYNPFASEEDKKDNAFLYNYVCESVKLLDQMVEKFYDGKSDESVDYKYLQYYGQMVELLSKMDRKEEALAVFEEKGKPLCIGASRIMKNGCDQVLASMQANVGDYASSIEFFKDELARSETKHDTVVMMQDLNQLCDIYKQKGDFATAYSYLERYHSLYKWKSRTDLLGQSSEYMTLFKVQEHEVARHDAESEALVSKIIASVTSAVLVIVFCLLLILWKQYYTIKKMNRTLVANINKIVDDRKRQEAIRAREVAESESGEAEKDRNVQLYIHELCARRLFCNPDFDRENLLAELNLPKTGFWKLFEEEIGQHFAGFLLNLRLEHAAEMIREHPELTVDAIAIDSGFSGRSTFYRNFTSRFGISPKVYRGELHNEAVKGE